MATSGAPSRSLEYESDEEVEVRCIMRVPGEPDKPVVARMPRWAVPKNKVTK